MEGEWETVSLESLIEPGRGISYGIVQPGAAVSDGVPIVRVSDVRDGRIATSAPLRVAPEVEAAYSRTRLAGGELLLTLVGTVGETAVVPDSLVGWNTARAVAVIPVRKEIGAYWVQMALRAPGVREIIDSRLNTTVQATLNLGDVAQLPIVLPSLREREAIAHILGTLDDKIELNRQMNETLEAMARALFKSWFVDFDPVRAKAEGRDPGLPKPLADLFSDSFEDSELGGIPAGWRLGPLENALVLQRGFDLPATQRTAGSYPVLAASGPSGTHNEFMVRGPGVTTGRSGALGKVFYVADDFWPLNTSLWVKEFRHSRPAYAFYLLRGLDFARFNAGSAVPTLNRNHIHTMLTLLPPMKLIVAFERIATASLARQSDGDQQSTTLATLRDALLPRLISGELRIKKTGRSLR